MDPASIVGLVSASGTIIKAITATVKGLSDLRGKYAGADLRIRLLIGELSTVKSALNQIHDWIEYNLVDSPTEADLVEGLSISLDGCQAAMDVLAEEVAWLGGGFAPSSRLDVNLRTRAKYAWNESSMKDHQDRLHAQIAALQLLLQAAQCRTNAEQTGLLRTPTNRNIIRKVADDTSTLRATMSAVNSSVASPSLVSHETSIIDAKIFDWDDDIVNAATYRRALTHARSKARLPEQDVEEAAKEQTGTQASSRSSSTLEPQTSGRQQKPQPYGVSENPKPIEAYDQQSRQSPQLAFVSHTVPERRDNPLRWPESPEVEKKSFWASLNVTRRSLRTSPKPQIRLSPPEAARATTGSRRGRRRLGVNSKTSIDFSSIDGLAAPAIVRAAQADSVIEVEMLLDHGAEIEACHSKSGRSALAVAAHCGNDDVFRLLLQYGAKVNVRDAFMLTPLHLAASRGHFAVVDLLLQEGAEIDAKGPDDETPLRVASDKGYVDVVELLLGRRAKVNARSCQQLTALHMAAKRGDEAMVDLLVSNGAHVEAKDANFMAAIHYASEAGHDGVVNLLLNKKANMEALGKASKTPLAYAASAGQLHIVELLLKKKASLKHKGEGDMNPLHWASFNGHVEVVDLLLQKHSRIDSPNKEGRTPLHLAAMADNFAVVELLIRKGVMVEAQCRHKLRPLHYACREASPDTVQLLLGCGASIEAEDSSAKRPLHFAAMRGLAPVVEVLVRKGVDTEARDAAGDRSLCLASSLGHLTIVKLLLDSGSPMRSRFSWGRPHEDSPMCVASKYGHTPIVTELVARGASVLQKDEHGWPPLRYAAFYGHAEVVEFLLLHGASVSSPSGGWGFNKPVSRMGFASNLHIDKDRKGQVLQLLHSAEAKEQALQKLSAAESAPLANSNQGPPVELAAGVQPLAWEAPAPLPPSSEYPSPIEPLRPLPIPPMEGPSPMQSLGVPSPLAALEDVSPLPSSSYVPTSKTLSILGTPGYVPSPDHVNTLSKALSSSTPYHQTLLPFKYQSIVLNGAQKLQYNDQLESSAGPYELDGWSESTKLERD